MSVRCNGRACVGSSTIEKKPSSFSSNTIQKQKSRKQEEEEEKDFDDETMKSTRTCSFRMPRKRDLSPLKYLKHLGGKMVGVLRLMSPRRASPKVTSSERAKPCVAPLDSHRAEAIDDCIEFINSSSSLPRSNSTTHA